jgi:hypothetical protein
MCLGGNGDGKIGASMLQLDAWANGVAPCAALFGEAGGFVVAVRPHDCARFETELKSLGAVFCRLGTTGGSHLKVDGICSVRLSELAAAWTRPLADLFA